MDQKARLNALNERREKQNRGRCFLHFLSGEERWYLVRERDRDALSSLIDARALASERGAPLPAPFSSMKLVENVDDLEFSPARGWSLPREQEQLEECLA